MPVSARGLARGAVALGVALAEGKEVEVEVHGEVHGEMQGDLVACLVVVGPTAAAPLAAVVVTMAPHVGAGCSVLAPGRLQPPSVCRSQVFTMPQPRCPLLPSLAALV